VFLQLGPDEFEEAGIEIVMDGVLFKRGGTLISQTALPDGRVEYALGLVLTHLSSLVATSEDLVPNTAPGAPADATAVSGNTQATVTWTAPAFDGGAPILFYTVTSGPATVARTTTATTLVFTGLANGTEYTFTIVATNSVGASVASAPSNPATPATVPGAPAGVAASIGDARSIVTWTAPASTGGSPITGFKVSSNPATTDKVVIGGSRTAIFTGLSNLVTYTFTVTARNVLGAGAASAASNAVTPAPAATPPGKPTAVAAIVLGSTSARVTWNAPSVVGGSLITGYIVTSNPASPASPLSVGNVTTADLTGLTPGQAYTFTVQAVNDAGAGAASDASTSITTPIATVPGAPTSVTAVAGDAQATVSWTAPASDGGSPILFYTVTSSPATVARTTTATNLVFTGLADGITYTFTVTATNAKGAGPAGVSNAVTTFTVPGAPTSVTATAGDAQATVLWTAPASNGGSPILFYTVTSSPATVARTTTATNLVFTGLTNGVTYTFTVTATNAKGAGPASAASNAVIPSKIPSPPGKPAITDLGPGFAVIAWTEPTDTGGLVIEQYRITYKGVLTDTAIRTQFVAGSLTQTQISLLINGVAYTSTVAAKNSKGFSAESEQSDQFTPGAKPTAPNFVVAKVNALTSTAVDVSWEPPTDAGESPIIKYTVKARNVTDAADGPSVDTLDGSTLAATVPGLLLQKEYFFTVRATNSQGTGPASKPSNLVKTSVKPGAPTGVSATPGDKSATVIWTKPASDGGSPITSYTVTSSPDGKTTTVNGSTFTADVMGLINGTAYTFTVKATNAIGTGPDSAPFAAVTPGPAPAAPDVSKPVSPTKNPTVTLSVTAKEAGKIRVTGGAAMTETDVVTPFVAQDVTVALKLNQSNTLEVRSLNTSGAQSEAVLRVVVHDNIAPVLLDADVSTPKSPTKAPKVILLVDNVEVDATVIVTGDVAPVSAVALVPGKPVKLEVNLNINAVNNLVVTVTDKALNQSKAINRTVVQDQTAPAKPVINTVDGVLPGALKPTKNASVVLNVTAETGSTIKVTGGKEPVSASASTVNITVNLNTNEDNTLELTATDAADNVSDKTLLTVTHDGVAPVLKLVTAPAFVNSADGKVTVKVFAEANALITIKVVGQAADVTGTALGLDVGKELVVQLTKNFPNAVEVTASDAAGNVSAAETVTVVHDDLPPVLPNVVFPPSNTDTLVAFFTLKVIAEANTTISVTGGVETVFAKATGGEQSIAVGLKKGLNTLKVKATDLAGNASGEVTRVVNLTADVPDAPTVNVFRIDGVTPVTDAPINAAKVIVKVTNIPAGMTKLTVKGGKAEVNTTIPSASEVMVVELTLNAINALETFVTSPALLESAHIIRLVKEDSIAPAQPTLLVPLPELTSALAIVAKLDAESGVRVVATELNTNTVIGEETVASPVDLLLVLVPDAENLISNRAIDGASNTSPALVALVRQDSTPPDAPKVATLPKSPTNLAVVTFKVVADATTLVTVKGGVLDVSFTADGSAQEVSVQLANLGNKVQNTLVLTAADGAGNTSKPTIVVVFHDNVPPAAPVLGPAPAFTLSAFVTIKVTGEVGAAIKVTGGAVVVSGITASGAPLPVIIPLTANATNVLAFTLTDAAGNVSAPTTVNVTRGPVIAPISGKIGATPAQLTLPGGTPALVQAFSSPSGALIGQGPVAKSTGIFLVPGLNPAATFKVALLYNNAGVSKQVWYKAGAPGNITEDQSQATLVTPGSNGAVVEMSLLTTPVITGVSGGGGNDAARPLTIDGANLANVKNVFLKAPGFKNVKVDISSPTDVAITGTIPKGAKPGVYNVVIKYPPGRFVTSAGRSMFGPWPQSSSTSSVAPGILDASMRPFSSGITRSSAPQKMSVGALMSASFGSSRFASSTRSARDSSSAVAACSSLTAPRRSPHSVRVTSQASSVCSLTCD
jgi:hypothetical protein